MGGWGKGLNSQFSVDIGEDTKINMYLLGIIIIIIFFFGGGGGGLMLPRQYSKTN